MGFNFGPALGTCLIFCLSLAACHQEEVSMPQSPQSAASAGREYSVALDNLPADRTAAFSLWLPGSIDKENPVRGLILASDYQAGTEIYSDPQYRALATRLHLGMLRHKLYAAQGDNQRIGPSSDEQAAQLLLDGLAKLAALAGQPEVQHASLIHTGLSWSGHQAPALAAALPKRTIAVVTYHASHFGDLENAYGVPLLLVVAEYDQFYAPQRCLADVRQGRGAGAPWTAVYQPGLTHETLGDPTFMLAWLEEVIALRLPAAMPVDTPAELKPIDTSKGYWGLLHMDPATQRRVQSGKLAEVFPANRAKVGGEETSWLPNKAVATLWRETCAAPDPSPHAKRPLDALGSPAKPYPVPVALHTMTVDGDAVDWRDVATLPAPYSKKSVGSLKLCWTPEGLWGLVQAVDAEVETHAQEPWRADCLELFIEKDFAQAPQRSKEQMQLALAPGGESDAAIVWPQDVQGKVKAAWKRTDGGYALEFLIPAEVLAPGQMLAGTRLGFNYCLSNGGKPMELFFCDKDHGGFAIPALWGALELTATDKP